MNTENGFWVNMATIGGDVFSIFELALILLIPGIALAVIIAIVASVISWFKPGVARHEVISLFGMALVLGFVAFVVGFIAANSRETVIGDVIPVLIGGFGALLVYTYIKGEVQTFAAGAAATVFSACLFTGMISGGKNRDQLGVLDGNAPNFSNVVFTPDEVSGHRGDVVAYNATLSLLQEIGTKNTSEIVDHKVLEAIESFVLPRRNFHFIRAFTSEEVGRYNALRERFPDLDVDTIEARYKGDDLILFREIHFALNPLEELKE